MTGTMIAAPISMKTWLRCGAAASQIVTRAGMMSGQIDMPSPIEKAGNRKWKLTCDEPPAEWLRD